MQVYIVTEDQRYSSSCVIIRVMDTQEAADRFVTMRLNEYPDADVEYKVVPATVGTVTDEEYQRSESFRALTDAAEWEHGHDMAKDDSYMGSISQRMTCRKCGSSIIQFDDGRVRDHTTYPCEEALRG